MAHQLGQNFERAVVKAFNDYFIESGIKGYAYRMHQTKFLPQDIDILVDSPNRNYYLAIECKSRTISPATPGMYFDPHMRKQITNQTLFLEKTGRKGYMAIEFRPKVPQRKAPRIAFMVPHEAVYKMLLTEKFGVVPEDLIGYPRLQYLHESYIIPEELMHNDKHK